MKKSIWSWTVPFFTAFLHDSFHTYRDIMQSLIMQSSLPHSQKSKKILTHEMCKKDGIPGYAIIF